MKFNISYPINGTQTNIDIDDDKKCQPFFDRRIGHEVDGSSLGDEWAGYVLKVSGGNDKQGFPMKQGILVKGRIKVFMDKGHSCYRPRRKGERKRKTVRGCIVGPDIRTLSVVVVKKGDKDVEGLTDVQKPRRLGPKRANKLKKLFGLVGDDKMETSQQTALLRQNVIRRTFSVGDKNRQKAPKIQRLVTADRIRSKVIARKAKKSTWESSKAKLEEYNRFLTEFKKKQARKASLEAAKRKASSESKEAVKAPVKKAAPVKAAKKEVPQTKKAQKK